jgi:hypothetical protein
MIDAPEICRAGARSWAGAAQSGLPDKDPVECRLTGALMTAAGGQERTCSLAPDCIVESAG